MKSSFRLTLLLIAAVLLVPVPGAAQAKKRNWHLGDRTLREGMEGHDVKILQSYLARTGQDAGVDGVFGSGTKNAVRNFERGQRRKVDGVVSRPDVAVLRDVALNGGAVASVDTTGGALPKNEPLPPPPVPAPLQLGPGMTATVGPDGLAIAPALAPPAILAVIDAGNRIATKPYIYGGGHGQWEDDGYDCSGSVSYALHGGDLLDEALPSGSFMSWGEPGPGTWITVYANGGHAYMVVAGLRFDTSGRTGTGSRWQSDMRSGNGYTVVHPTGY